MALRKSLERFSVSDTWAKNCVKRHNLQCVILHGQAGDVNAAAIADGMAHLKDTMKNYEMECIYNVDGTGLVPRKTYITAMEERRSVRGTKGMASKDCITAYLCANASGTQKVPFSIIGKSKNPHCFKFKPCPVKYFSQANAWSDQATFSSWFHDVFLQHIRSCTRRPVILVMDNCSGHGNLNDPHGQVSIAELPLIARLSTNPWIWVLLLHGSNGTGPGF